MSQSELLTDYVQSVAARVKAAFGDEDADVIGATLAYVVAAYFLGFPDQEMREQTIERWTTLMNNLMDSMETLGGRMQ